MSYKIPLSQIYRIAARLCATPRSLKTSYAPEYYYFSCDAINQASREYVAKHCIGDDAAPYAIMGEAKTEYEKYLSPNKRDRFDAWFGSTTYANATKRVIALQLMAQIAAEQGLYVNV